MMKVIRLIGGNTRMIFDCDGNEKGKSSKTRVESRAL
jgi:hypothetical protein